MSKIIAKPGHKRQKRDDTASVVARICKVTPRYVRMVMNGEYENEAILEACIEYKLGKNRLIREVEKLVSFTPKK